MRNNYPFPLDFSVLTNRGQEHEKCSLEESIQRHIFLMLVTRYGASRYSYNYGCELWIYDFDSPSSINKKKPKLEQSIKSLLEEHETRLGSINVSINISQEDIPVGKFGTVLKAKKKVTLSIKARILETNRLFKPKPFIVYFSPIMLNMD